MGGSDSQSAEAPPEMQSLGEQAAELPTEGHPTATVSRCYRLGASAQLLGSALALRWSSTAFKHGKTPLRALQITQAARFPVSGAE